MKQPSFGKAALAVSVFTCATMLSFDWSEQKGVSLSIERAQAQMDDPYTPGVARRQARRAAAGVAAVGAGAVAAGATAAYYGSGGGPYAYYATAAPLPITAARAYGARTTRRATASSASPAQWSASTTA